MEPVQRGGEQTLREPGEGILIEIDRDLFEVVV